MGRKSPDGGRPLKLRSSSSLLPDVKSWIKVKNTWHRIGSTCMLIFKRRQKSESIAEEEVDSMFDKQDSTLDSLHSHNIDSSTLFSDDKDTVVALTDFSKFDPVIQCKQLRKTHPEPFVGGEMIWKRRRKLWNASDPSVDGREEYDKQHAYFKNIPVALYSKVYCNLVVESKPLKEPLNLEDATKIISFAWAFENALSTS